MITVEEATRRIAGAFHFIGPELAAIADVAGRVAADDVVACCDQPPAPVSAMDGYAVRAADVAHVPATLDIVGEAPAGRPFAGDVRPGGAVRIFTGGVVPEGADAVVIQEDTAREGSRVVIREPARAGQNVRGKGLDFGTGQTIAARGKRLTPRDVSLIAAADVAELAVARRPSIGIVATGDELSRPGEKRKPGGIVASSTYGIAAMIEAWGGTAKDLGIFPDTPEAFARLPAVARGCDLIVTLGGASVGDHDLVQSALAPHGFALDFWKVAMRPGKPLIFGRLGATPLLGLPGNPVSAMVCAILFVRPAIAVMLGIPFERRLLKARLKADLAANGPREDYIRARTIWRADGLWAEPFPVQDSSMQKVLADANALIVRAIGATAAAAGEFIDVLPLDEC